MDSAHHPRPSPDQEFFRGLLDAATEVLILLIDLDGMIAYVNRGSRWLLGYEPDEMFGHHYSEFLPGEELAQAVDRFQDAAEGHPRQREWITARRKDADLVLARFDATPFQGPDGALEGIVLVGHEVSTYEAPRERPVPPDGEARGTAELVERLPAVSYVAEPGAEGRWRYVSPQIEAMLGYTVEEWLADPGLWARCIHPEDRGRVLKREEEDPRTGWVEYRMIARDGRVLWVRDEAVLRTDPDGTYRFDGILIDVTDRKRFESRLQFLAEHDPLTGVLNRRRFLEELEGEIRRMRRQPHPAALLMLDLDNLKEVNDSFGHGVGDALIRATAGALSERLRETDTVGRLGGDEFAVLLRGATSEEAALVAEELVAAIRARGQAVTDRRASPAVSAGVTDLRARLAGADAALAAADQAMYEAKRRGGGRVATYSQPPENDVPQPVQPE